MAIMYEYGCQACRYQWEEMLSSDDRYKPVNEGCPKCGKLEVMKVCGNAGFTVPEGGCGNASNGYSSYHGDAELFKAKGRDQRDKLKREYGLKK